MEQINLLNDNFITLTSNVEKDLITEKISKIFDYEWDGCNEEKIIVPTFPKDFQIGLIVGSSGSGKSTLLKQFGDEEKIEWDNSKCVASHFETFEECSQKFGAVGLNSIPTWLKPYRVLSNGEKFRVDMARRLKDNAVIDEFTSVVNREVAISCSCSISKYIKNNGLRNIVFCSCHDDIIPFLRPDWIYDTDTHELIVGRLPQRPKIEIKFRRCSTKMWSQFKKYHYLSGEINKSATCYVGEYNDIPIVFIALISQMGKDVKHAWREHRVVVLPDYQGMGIGNKTSEMFAQAYIEKGCQYFAKTSNVRMGEHRDKSPLWRGTCNNHKDRHDYLKFRDKIFSQEFLSKHALRVCYSHEYIGDGTKYPYTLETQYSDKQIIDENQISWF